MVFQDLSWNICTSSVGILAASVFEILSKTKSPSLVYTAECMINYIIYRCQYETVPGQFSGAYEQIVQTDRQIAGENRTTRLKGRNGRRMLTFVAVGFFLSTSSHQAVTASSDCQVDAPHGMPRLQTNSHDNTSDQCQRLVTGV